MLTQQAEHVLAATARHPPITAPPPAPTRVMRMCAQTAGRTLPGGAQLDCTAVLALGQTTALESGCEMRL